MRNKFFVRHSQPYVGFKKKIQWTPVTIISAPAMSALSTVNRLPHTTVAGVYQPDGQLAQLFLSEKVPASDGTMYKRMRSGALARA